MSSAPDPGAGKPGTGAVPSTGHAGHGDVSWASDVVPEELADYQAAEAAAAAAGSGPGDGDDAGAEGPAAAGGAGPEGEVSFTVEDLVRDLERVTSERDQYLDVSRRIQADFENYKKAVAKREHEARERANESLVAQILPVLDACDGALASGAADVEPVRSALIDTLVKQGLDRIDEAEAPFDPERHDAVMHEPSEGSGGPVVAEVLRAGYSWKGRVVRPAMVRVRG